MWKQMVRNWMVRKLAAYKRSKLLFFTAVGQLCAFLLASAFFLVGIPAADYSLMMFGTLAVWFASVIYCFADLKSRMLLLSFDAVVFVFLMCRPLLDIARGMTRWHYYAEASVAFAIVSVAVSVFSMHIGAVICEALQRENKTAPKKTIDLVPRNHHVAVFRQASFLLYLVCAGFYLVREMDALIFMQGRTYTDYYTEYSPSYPSIIYTVSQMMPYALCVYLATFPEKKKAFLVLASYVLSAIPQLLIGIRNPIVLNVIFAFLYYCIRDYLGDEKKWIGMFEKSCIAVGVPLCAVALSVYNYVRDGVAVASTGFFAAIEDLFYKQGVSFDVLCMGHNAIPSLPGAEKCYTFGPFIDSFLRGTIGQALFGMTPFPAGNSEIRAIEGNSFAHSMSYVAHPDYLEGGGWGSSYILEIFADWGWLGIIVFSMLLGAFLIWVLRGMSGHWLLRTTLLVSLTQMLFIPRAEAMGWWSFLTGIHFWAAVIACVVGSKMMQMLGAVWPANYNKK